MELQGKDFYVCDNEDVMNNDMKISLFRPYRNQVKVDKNVIHACEHQYAHFQHVRVV